MGHSGCQVIEDVADGDTGVPDAWLAEAPVWVDGDYPSVVDAVAAVLFGVF